MDKFQIGDKVKLKPNITLNDLRLTSEAQGVPFTSQVILDRWRNTALEIKDISKLVPISYEVKQFGTTYPELGWYYLPETALEFFDFDEYAPITISDNIELSQAKSKSKFRIGNKVIVKPIYFENRPNTFGGVTLGREYTIVRRNSLFDDDYHFFIDGDDPNRVVPFCEDWLELTAPITIPDSIELSQVNFKKGDRVKYVHPMWAPFDSYLKLGETYTVAQDSEPRQVVLEGVPSNFLPARFELVNDEPISIPDKIELSRNKFKVGNRVVCVDDDARSGQPYLHVGEFYTIFYINGSYVSVEEEKTGSRVMNIPGDVPYKFDFARFELAPDEPIQIPDSIELSQTNPKTFKVGGVVQIRSDFPAMLERDQKLSYLTPQDILKVTGIYFNDGRWWVTVVGGSRPTISETWSQDWFVPFKDEPITIPDSIELSQYEFKVGDEVRLNFESKNYSKSLSPTKSYFVIGLAADGRLKLEGVSPFLAFPPYIFDLVNEPITIPDSIELSQLNEQHYKEEAARLHIKFNGTQHHLPEWNMPDAPVFTDTSGTKSTFYLREGMSVEQGLAEHRERFNSAKVTKAAAEFRKGDKVRYVNPQNNSRFDSCLTLGKIYTIKEVAGEEMREIHLVGVESNFVPERFELADTVIEIPDQIELSQIIRTEEEIYALSTTTRGFHVGDEVVLITTTLPTRWVFPPTAALNTSYTIREVEATPHDEREGDDTAFDEDQALLFYAIYVKEFSGQYFLSGQLELANYTEPITIPDKIELSLTNAVQPATWAELEMTSLCGEVDISYQELVNIFGKPHAKGGPGDKIAAEWLFKFPDGESFTIYNYKDGRNYTRDGLATKDIRDWHVGGKTGTVFERVKELISGVNEPITIPDNIELSIGEYDYMNLKVGDRVELNMGVHCNTGDKSNLDQLGLYPNTEYIITKRDKTNFDNSDEIAWISNAVTGEPVLNGRGQRDLGYWHLVRFKLAENLPITIPDSIELSQILRSEEEVDKLSKTDRSFVAGTQVIFVTNEPKVFKYPPAMVINQTTYTVLPGGYKSGAGQYWVYLDLGGGSSLNFLTGQLESVKDEPITIPDSIELSQRGNAPFKVGDIVRVKKDSDTFDYEQWFEYIKLDDVSSYTVSVITRSRVGNYWVVSLEGVPESVAASGEGNYDAGWFELAKEEPITIPDSIELSQYEFKIGDRVQTTKEYETPDFAGSRDVHREGIVRWIGPYQGRGTEECVWSDWGGCPEYVNIETNGIGALTYHLPHRLELVDSPIEIPDSIELSQYEFKKGDRVQTNASWEDKYGDHWEGTVDKVELDATYNSELQVWCRDWYTRDKGKTNLREYGRYAHIRASALEIKDEPITIPDSIELSQYKFKIGDRVRTTKEHDAIAEHWEGTVLNINATWVESDWNGTGHGVIGPEDLELINEPIAIPDKIELSQTSIFRPEAECWELSKTKRGYKRGDEVTFVSNEPSNWTYPEGMVLNETKYKIQDVQKRTDDTDVPNYWIHLEGVGLNYLVGQVEKVIDYSDLIVVPDHIELSQYTFKIGDRVRYIRKSSINNDAGLEPNAIYTVTGYNAVGNVTLAGVECGRFPERFELVENEHITIPDGIELSQIQFKVGDEVRRIDGSWDHVTEEFKLIIASTSLDGGLLLIKQELRNGSDPNPSTGWYSAKLFEIVHDSDFRETITIPDKIELSLSEPPFKVGDRVQYNPKAFSLTHEELIKSLAKDGVSLEGTYTISNVTISTRNYCDYYVVSLEGVPVSVTSEGGGNFFPEWFTKVDDTPITIPDSIELSQTSFKVGDRIRSTRLINGHTFEGTVSKIGAAYPDEDRIHCDDWLEDGVFFGHGDIKDDGTSYEVINKLFEIPDSIELSQINKPIFKVGDRVRWRYDLSASSIPRNEVYTVAAVEEATWSDKKEQAIRLEELGGEGLFFSDRFELVVITIPDKIELSQNVHISQ